MSTGMLTFLLNQKARTARIPISGTFELSPICNLSCKMCYVRKTPAEVAAHSRPLVTLEQWKQIADEAFDSGMLFLLLTGGEPFLWQDFKELYTYLAHKGFVISINSNGTLISDEMLELLKENPPAHINITLYGGSDETYERLCGVKGMYKRVTGTIDRLRDAGVLVKLKASMTPYNVCDMDKIIEFAKERSLVLEMGTYMFPPIRRDEESYGKGDRFTPEEAAFYNLQQKRLMTSPEVYRELLKQVVEGSIPPPGLDEACIDPIDGQVRCQAGRGMFWATWDGYMTPCGMMLEPKADLISLGFNEAWKQTVESTEKMRLSGVCENCKNKDLCHCCASMAIAETGSPSGIPQYLCRMADEMRRLAQEELNRIV